MILPDDQARWRPWLLPAERLLWAGRPARGLAFSRADLYAVPLLALWLAMLVFENGRVLRDGGPFALDFPTLFILLLGGLLLAGRFPLDLFLRSRLFYALTDRRVLILNAGSGKLKSIDIEYLPMLDLEEDRGGRGTLVFASGDGERSWRENLSPAFQPGVRFYRIEDARRVYDLARQQATRIRRETHGDPPPHLAFLG
ncbi:MAG TPA: hypothetical protein VHM92_09215 [Allosphingosinicella sp.]|nr:hypothetical protein [Allosphingosinicella sp.]